MKCLEKKAADRWQTAEELLPQLEALATPSGGVTPTGAMSEAALRGRRVWLAAASAVVVVGVIVVALSRMLASSPITITTSNIHAVTSEPGLEWHPALSPDGDEVAFVAPRASGMRVVIRSTSHAAGGGELTPTRELGGSEWLIPAWSADGEFIHSYDCPRGATAFAHCRCTRIGRLGGAIRSLDLPRTPTACAWSPDGASIAFTTWPDSIFTYSISDGTTTALAASEVAPAMHSPVWSPDGGRIAYVTGNQSWRWRFNVDMSAIWIVDAGGGEPVRVTGDEYMDISPAWLDDSHLLFVSNRDGLREVYVVEVGPTGPRGEPLKVPGATDPHSISYSIVGKKLAFSKATARQNVRAYPIGSGPVSVRDGFPVTNENAIIQRHDISPDGKWIVYDSNLRGNSDIYKKRLDGGSPIPITDSPLDESEPQWSPNGSDITFSRAVGDSRTVMVAAAEGGIPYEVASGIAQVWSPSGLDIAFVPIQQGQNGIWVASRDSVGGIWGEATRLTDACPPRDWAPDGSGVLLQCRGGREIALVSRDGEALWRYDVTLVGLRRLRGDAVRYSRDGSTIYFTGPHEDGTSGIWAIPPQGGEPTLVVAFDDAEISGTNWFSVGPDHLYVTVAEYESDIWVMDVEVAR
jgi:Tol biopolymer transport system component